MRNPALPTRSAGAQRLARALALAILCSPLLSSCVSWKAQAQRYAAIAPTRYLIVHPQGRQAWPAVEAFAAFKRGQGFAVEHLAFELDGTPAERFARVSRALAERRPAAGESAYVLFLATHDELPMGPWPIAGQPEGVHSELPLLAGHTELDSRLRDRDWMDALDFPPVWIPGRLPYDEEPVVAAALTQTQELHELALEGAPRALLGTERVIIPKAAALIMSGVRDELVARGWEAVQLSEDRPRDEPLDEPALNLTTTHADGTEEPRGVLHPSFIAQWLRSSPELVYLISHASAHGIITHDAEHRPLRSELYIGAGRMLLDARSLFLWFRYDMHEQLDLPARPSAPALLVTTGCSTGTPTNPLLATLVREGWMAAFCGSTTTNGPLPPIAALRAERSMPRYLTHDLPLGLALHACVNAYLSDSRSDPLGWLLYPWASRVRRANVLSYVNYGDPSLRLPGGAQP